MKLKIGTYTKNESKGIYSIELDPVKGTLDHYKLEVEIDSPTYIAESGLWMASVVKEGNQGGVALIYDGKIVDRALADGAPPCYVSFDGNRIYSANYHKGRIEAYGYESGKLEFLDAIQYGEGAKGHYVQVDPQTGIVFVCDLGSDKIGAYRFEEGFKEIALIDVAKGSGPRHLAFSPTQPLLYCLSELSNEILVIDKESFEILQVQSTLESDDDKKSGAAVRVSKDGHYVYVSNRGTNTVTTFKVEGKTLKKIDSISTFGDHPRDFNLVADDRYVVVANMNSNDLTLYSRDAKSGKLVMIQKEVQAFEPVCIIE